LVKSFIQFDFENPMKNIYASYSPSISSYTLLKFHFRLLNFRLRHYLVHLVSKCGKTKFIKGRTKSSVKTLWMIFMILFCVYELYVNSIQFKCVYANSNSTKFTQTQFHYFHLNLIQVCLCIPN
jgi:hypothetical protein